MLPAKIPTDYTQHPSLSSQVQSSPALIFLLPVLWQCYGSSSLYMNTYIWFLHSPTLFLHRLVPHRLQVQNVLGNLSPSLILSTDQVLQWNDQLITWVFHSSTDIPLNTLPVFSKAIKLNISFQNSVRQWFETLTGKPLKPKYNINAAGYGSLCFKQPRKMGRSDGTHSMSNEGGGKITAKAVWISVPCIFNYFWVLTKNLRLQQDHTHLSSLKLSDYLNIVYWDPYARSSNQNCWWQEAQEATLIVPPKATML